MGEEIELTLKDIVSKLPESDRAEAEKGIGEAVAAGNILAGVDSQEKAFELIKKTPILKSAFDAEISKTVDAHDERFIKDKLPKLVEDKVREMNPPKDPRDIKLAELEAKMTERDNAEKKAKLHAAALKIAAEKKIPVEDIERFIADDEDATVRTVNAYAERILAWRNEAIEASKQSQFGNNGKPKNGNIPPVADLQTQYELAAKANNGIEMLRLKSLIQEPRRFLHLSRIGHPHQRIPHPSAHGLGACACLALLPIACVLLCLGLQAHRIRRDALHCKSGSILCVQSARPCYSLC